MMAADCDHCGGWLMDAPPEFNLPPPPLPPFMQPELCNSAVFDPHASETCQAFLVEDAEYQVPLDSPPSLAAIVVSAAILTALVILIATLLLWRYRKQKEQHKVVLRCQQKSGLNGGGMMDTVPALLQGLAGGGSGNNRRPGTINDDVDGVFYDELMSYHPTHYRTPHHQPPAYEMKDVLLKTSPCHCTAHPLLGRGTTGRATLLQSSSPQHYVTSPYHSSSNSSSTPTTANADDRADSGGSWIAEPVYEELPSGPEEDYRSPRDQRRNNQHCYLNGSVGINHAALRGSQRGGSSLRRNGSNNWSGGSDEPAETDLFLAPTTWYQQHNSLRGQLTTQGPVRPGRGGIKAAWKELEPAKLKRKGSQQTSDNGSINSQSIAPPQPTLHYQSSELYRGRCPPEAPPVSSSSFEDEDGSPSLEPDRISPDSRDATPAAGNKTLPRYYYYSESDDYAANNPVQRTLSSNTGRRGQQQRHLARAHRTTNRRSPI